jgi:phospholipase C
VGTIFRVPDGSTPIDHTSVLKTIEQRWSLPALTARDAAAPSLASVLTLTTPRTDDPLAGVSAPTSSGENPAVGEVSHLLSVQAQRVSDLQVPLSRLQGAPLLVDQHTPADFEHYIAARTGVWKAAKAAGDAPGRSVREAG